ncbi:hypothetical protein BGZ46_003533 [Entomortierella lignicola]|nr:hypothetical protein BGZ46_003533 [Entomortierella lignicola]
MIKFDEIEELTDAKTRLEDKVTQLEERAQYQEATSRLNASKVASEIVDLKEKARKLEIELSSVIDERDSLEQDIEQLKAQGADTEVKDEARHLSIQLKDAWLRISTMKTSQEDMVKKLFKAEETLAKVNAELTKTLELSNLTKSEHADDKKRWENDKKEYLAEINSFKEKLKSSSKAGGEKLLDWEQDKTRLRNSFNHERATWDKEKKGFMDQIASLKIKATALGMQKTAPPEWILEKHQLTEQCAALQSRVTTLESERSNESGNKKLEAEKLKLEKKVENLKAKLIEVMGQAMSMQDEVKSKQDPSKKTAAAQRRRPAPRRKRRSPTRNIESDDEVVVITAEEEEIETIKEIDITEVVPIKRETRAKRSAAVKSVNYQVDTSSDQSEESDEEDEDEDEDQDMEVDEDEDEADGSTDGEEQDGDAEMQERDNSVNSKDINEKLEEVARAGDDNAQSSSSSRSRKASLSKPRKSAEASSDSEFEPPKKTVIVKVRSRRNVRKSASPSAEPAPKKAKIPATKKRLNDGETSDTPDTPSAAAVKGKSVVSNDSPRAPVQSTSNASSSTSTPATTSSETIATSKPVTAASTTTEKIKKKRKLLTGKGLEELGDILNGPGSSLSSTPSTGLVFGKSKIRLNNASSATSGGGGTSNPANLDALNAIKMAFNLPKPRIDPSTRDNEI